jgi:hypothetical protein
MDIGSDGVEDGDGGTLPTELGLLSEMTEFKFKENSIAGECLQDLKSRKVCEVMIMQLLLLHHLHQEQFLPRLECLLL